MEVVDDISRVAAPEVRHGHGDLLVVVAQVDADIFLQLLTPAQRSVRRVLVKHPAVEQVLLRDLQHNAQRTTQNQRHEQSESGVARISFC